MLYEPYLRISSAKIQIIFEICKYFYHFCYLIFLFFCIFLKYLHFSIFFVPSAHCNKQPFRRKIIARAITF